MGIFENMKEKIVWIFLLFSIFSCDSAEKEKEDNGICSTEQIEKFEKCTENYTSFYDRTIREMGDKIPDSILNFYKDVRDMELPEIITKYKIEKHQINLFIQSVCVSDKIENAYQKLDDKLSEANINLEENRIHFDSLNSTEKFDYSKIQPMEFDQSNYLNTKDGKHFYIKNGDTVFVKVKVAKYEE